MLDISENFKLTNCRKVDHLADNFLIENQIIDRNTHTKVLSITYKRNKKITVVFLIVLMKIKILVSEKKNFNSNS